MQDGGAENFQLSEAFHEIRVFFSFHEVKLKVTPCTKNRHSLHSSHATYVFFVQEKSARQDSIQGGGYIPYEKTMDFQVKLGGYPENSRANSVDTNFFPRFDRMVSVSPSVFLQRLGLTCDLSRNFF